ncbi:uncharacterized protein si:ch211-269k10.4 [Megalops cyprinoides]|uniref:uncharacterized protein si:ch211-269k10.4 n=1 Tax=Megalops cyprinoides TaxID=118141 RepID=UPI001865650F|nr:uncharacterized protein si:ch211-269k10.4 [Megalops cyprinoides]
MACVMRELIEQEDDRDEMRKPLIKQYCATDVVPAKMQPLHDLLQKQPAAIGVVQMVSGITIFGLGVVLATTSPLTLAIIFRVPILTGLLFFISGMLSAMLHKFTRLLPICVAVNIGCLCVAGVGVVLLTIDLALATPNASPHIKVKVLVMCVTVLEMCITAVLLFWMRRELRSTNKTA